MTNLDFDRRMLLRAIELAAAQVRDNLGGPFGAVVVRNGRIIAEGCNEVTRINDPTAHAEVVAIRRACTAESNFSLAGTTMYASCEPCPMCLAAIYWARIDRIVFAKSRQEAAAIGFDDAFIYEEIPKPIASRSIPTLHMPLNEADAAFAAWTANPDKIEY